MKYIDERGSNQHAIKVGEPPGVSPINDEKQQNRVAASATLKTGVSPINDEKQPASINEEAKKVRVLDPSTLKTEEKEKVTLDEAAKELNVSKAKLRRMKYIDQHGSDELKEEVKQGKKAIF